jgi:uncharacterized protein (TIGR02246 family)
MLRNVWLCTAVLAPVLLFAGWKTAPQPVQKSDTAADIQVLDTPRNQFATAYNSHDAAAAATCFADDAILVHPNQETIEGRQDNQAKLEAYFKENAAKITHTSLDTHVAGDWAYKQANIPETGTQKSDKPTENPIKYLVILKRGPDGAWKVYRDMSNSNLKEPA